MEKLNCLNCGAPVKMAPLYRDIYRCEYCGTDYRLDNTNKLQFVVEHVNSPVDVIYARTIYPESIRYHVDESMREEIMTNMKRELARDIGYEMLKNGDIEIEEELDPWTMGVKVMAKARVLKPTYHF